MEWRQSVHRISAEVASMHHRLNQSPQHECLDLTKAECTDCAFPHRKRRPTSMLLLTMVESSWRNPRRSTLNCRATLGHPWQSGTLAGQDCNSFGIVENSPAWTNPPCRVRFAPVSPNATGVVCRHRSLHANIRREVLWCESGTRLVMKDTSPNRVMW